MNGQCTKPPKTSVDVLSQNNIHILSSNIHCFPQWHFKRSYNIAKDRKDSPLKQRKREQLHFGSLILVMRAEHTISVFFRACSFSFSSQIHHQVYWLYVKYGISWGSQVKRVTAKSNSPWDTKSQSFSLQQLWVPSAKKFALDVVHYGRKWQFQPAERFYFLQYLHWEWKNASYYTSKSSSY